MSGSGLCCAALLALSAQSATNPYELIAARNPFGLKQPESSRPVAPPMPAPTAGLEIKLTGISTFLPRKQALLVSAAPAKPVRYHTLAEGDEVEGIRVMAIHPEAGSVEVLLEGVPMTLSFQSHGFDRAFLSTGPRTLLETRRFVEEHTRSHEERQRREWLRVQRERAAAAAEVKAQPPDSPRLTP